MRSSYSNYIHNFHLNLDGDKYFIYYNKVFRWNDSTSDWDNILSFSYHIYGVTKNNNDLYIVGNINTSNNKFTKWDGTSLQNIGIFNNLAVCIETDDYNNVYIGGHFTTIDGITFNRFAKWNGTSFQNIGNFDNYIETIFKSSTNSIYVGGNFTTIDGVTFNRFAKWNGTSWENLGNFNDNITSICEDSKGNIYVSGDFTTIDGVTFNRFAKWNGTSWENLGNFNNFVHSICCDNDDNIYAVGSFSTIDGVTFNRIAKWNGTSWETELNNEYTTTITKIACDKTNNSIFIGSNYTMDKYNNSIFTYKLDSDNFRVYNQIDFSDLTNTNANYES
jgi:hypothetical protein